MSEVVLLTQCATCYISCKRAGTRLVQQVLCCRLMRLRISSGIEPSGSVQ